MKSTRPFIRTALIVLGVTTSGWANLSNTASLTYRDSLNNPYTGNSNTVVVTVVQAPSIVLTKSVSPTTASVGSQVTFTIAYSNGGGNATNVVISDTIPTGSTLVAGSITGTGSSVSGNIITWTIGNVAAGASGSVSFKVTAN